MRIRSAAVAVTVVSGLITSGALSPSAADDSVPIGHLISMRSFVADDAPRFVAAVATADDERSAAVLACDGQTYFLAASDAAAVQVALGNADTVQLHTTQGNDPPSEAAIICLFEVQE